MQKARLSALEVELEELRAWKAQVVLQIPREHVGISKPSGAGQRVTPRTREGVTTAKGEEPVLPNSRLGLGDLRHSLLARKENLHRGQDKSKGASVRAPSGVSVAPES